jgi:two-component sensor histidine kinase
VSNTDRPKLRLYGHVPILGGSAAALAFSMIGDDRPVILKVVGEGSIATCRNAESLGFDRQGFVINAPKHAFNDRKDGQIIVSYEISGTDWKLFVADNGIGKPDDGFAQAKSGLGTDIVKALARQLDAQVETLSGDQGTVVSITHATFAGN